MLASELGDGPGFAEYDCRRCGEYRISQSLMPSFKNRIEAVPAGWIVLSRTIRRAQANDRDELFTIDSYNIASLLAGAQFPNPREQADDLILYLGSAGIAPGDAVSVLPEFLMGYLGTGDRGPTGKSTGLKLITNWLEKEGLIDPVKGDLDGASWLFHLTVKGWERYHDLQRQVPESRLAFMAMSYTAPNTLLAFTDCFDPAVEATGFKLRRLDTAPKAGLIDNRMRVEIRTCKFMVCDLTDDNRGAYWESGFAEGLGRPVFYTCETTKFEKEKTHFDTQHMLTIKWSLENLASAAEELKAAIRNTFPVEAKQSD